MQASLTEWAEFFQHDKKGTEAFLERKHGAGRGE